MGGRGPRGEKREGEVDRRVAIMPFDTSEGDMFKRVESDGFPDDSFPDD